MEAYICGLFDADGTDKSRPLVIASSVYPDYLRQIQTLMVNRGVRGNLALKRPKTGNWQPLYQLTVKDFDRVKSESFLNKYSLKFTNYVRRFKDTSEPITILEVKDYREVEETYDISVVNNHSFYCEFGALSHNTAEIMFGDAKDESFLNLKNPLLNKSKLTSHRWASNNSVFATVGMDYSTVSEMTAKNGEPGYLWLDNAREFSRMNKVSDHKDYKAMGANPSLRKGTLIWTTKGIFPVEQLENEEFNIRNLNGKISKAKCFLSSSNAPLYKITLAGGHEYYSTKEHKWPIYTKQGYVKVETDDLKKGHLLPITKSKTISNGTLGDYTDGFFLGWLTGDGGIHTRKDNDRKQINLIVSEKDREDRDIAETLLSKLNSLKSEKSNWRERKGNYELSCSSKEVMTYLDKFGFEGKLNIPTNLFSDWSEEAIRGYINGIYSSDGSVDSKYKTARVSLFAKNLGLVKGVSNILGFYGVKTSINKKNTRLNGKEFLSYRLSTSDRISINHFKKTFKLSVRHKQETLDKISNDSNRIVESNHYEVLSVELTDLKEPVWDITVKDETHCFRLPHCVTGNCNEQSLEPWELCCLVETYPSNHDTLEEWIETLKYAYLYAKSVTLIPTHNELTNQVMLRNRRIGCSVSGITQAFTKFGRRNFLQFCDKGYTSIQEWDKKYSDWLCIPRSIKTTSVKPSGTVSLLAGVTPGIHYPIAEYYIRNIRFSRDSALLPDLKEKGYKIEDDKYSPSSVVVSFPVKEKYFDRAVSDVTIWEQMENVAQIQEYWADNQVSVTVSFKQEEAKDIKRVLEMYETRIKGVSFLPTTDHGYTQAPYIPITEKEYNKMVDKLNERVTKIKADTHDQDDKFCDGDSCQIGGRK